MIAVLGPGGVGGFVAGALARGGVPVTVIAREGTASLVARNGIEVRSVRGMEEVTVLCESVNTDGEAAISELAQALRLALGARLECRLVPPGTLPRSELKSRRLIRAT